MAMTQPMNAGLCNKQGPGGRRAARRTTQPSPSGLVKRATLGKHLRSFGVTSPFPLLCSLFSLPRLCPHPQLLPNASCELLHISFLLILPQILSQTLFKGLRFPLKNCSSRIICTQKSHAVCPIMGAKAERKSPMCHGLPGTGQCPLSAYLPLVSDALKASRRAQSLCS